MLADRGDGDASGPPIRRVAKSSSHGFELRAETSVFGLRDAADRAPLAITSGAVDPAPKSDEIGHWPAIPGKRAEVSIVAVEQSHVVTVGRMARFLVDTPSSTIVAQFAPGLPPMMQATTLMSSPLALCLVRAGNLAIHAAGAEVDGRGILLAAPGTGGKTTLAAGFHIAGHRVLSDDLIGVRPEGMVEPAAALLRLRYDAATALQDELPDVTSHLDDAGKRFFEVAEHRRGDGAAVPCSAVFFLAWADDDTIAIDDVSATTALHGLWRQAFYLQESPGAAETFERLASFVDVVPSFVIRRPRDFAKLQMTVNRIEELVRTL